MIFPSIRPPLEAISKTFKYLLAFCQFGGLKEKTLISYEQDVMAGVSGR